MVLRSFNEALYSLRRQEKIKCTLPPPSSLMLINNFYVMPFVFYPTTQFSPKCNWLSKRGVALSSGQFFLPCKVSWVIPSSHHTQEPHSLGTDIAEGGWQGGRQEGNAGALTSQRTSQLEQMSETDAFAFRPRKEEAGMSYEGQGQRAISYFLFSGCSGRGQRLLPEMANS